MKPIYVSVKPEKSSEIQTNQFLEKIEIAQINAVALGFPIKLELRMLVFEGGRKTGEPTRNSQLGFALWAIDP